MIFAGCGINQWHFEGDVSGQWNEGISGGFCYFLYTTVNLKGTEENLQESDCRTASRRLMHQEFRDFETRQEGKEDVFYIWRLAVHWYLS